MSIKKWMVNLGYCLYDDCDSGFYHKVKTARQKRKTHAATYLTGFKLLSVLQEDYEFFQRVSRYNHFFDYYSKFEISKDDNNEK